MRRPITTAFNLPDHLGAKAAAALLDADEDHFAAITDGLERSVAELTDRLAAARRAPAVAGDEAGHEAGQQAMERDQEVHRLTGRLRTLSRFGLDLCLGRMVREDDPTPVYVGRLGLTDDDGRRLLVDWRSPAAEPFFGATHARPMGLVSRRRYRWTDGRVTDYWDEVFAEVGLEGHAALDDQSAFIASLGASRSPRMRDVLGTIQADQDAIVRAGSRGTLVVDGGPGTGKVPSSRCTAPPTCCTPTRGSATVAVASSSWARTGPTCPTSPTCCPAWARTGSGRARCETSTRRVPSRRAEHDPEAERLKSSAAMVRAIEPAVPL